MSGRPPAQGRPVLLVLDGWISLLEFRDHIRVEVVALCGIPSLSTPGRLRARVSRTWICWGIRSGRSSGPRVASECR